MDKKGLILLILVFLCWLIFIIALLCIKANAQVTITANVPETPDNSFTTCVQEMCGHLK